MPVSKPALGSQGWGTALNAALDDMDVTRPTSAAATALSSTYIAFAPEGVASAATNTTALQAAIDALSTAGGGVLRGRGSGDPMVVALASGQRYALTVPSNVEIDGLDLTLDPASVAATNSTHHVIEVGTATVAAENVTIRNCRINCNASAHGLSTIGIGNRQEGGTVRSAHITITNNYVENCALGIAATKASTPWSGLTGIQHLDWKVTGNTVVNASNKAIEFQETTHSTIANNFCDDVSAGPQVINGCTYVTIIGNTVRYNSSGINITHGCSHITVTGNVVQALDAASAGAMILRTEPVAEGPTTSHVTITGNTFTDTVSASKNVFKFQTRTENTGTPTWSSILVSNNIFRGNVLLYDEGPKRTSTSLDLFRFIGNTVELTASTHAGQPGSRCWVQGNGFRVAFTQSTGAWVLEGNEFNAGLTIAASYVSARNNKTTTLTVTSGQTYVSLLQNIASTSLTDSGTGTMKANNIVAWALVP